jgi:hypothetical protein
MLHHPFNADSPHFSSGGIWEPTAENFPALKHFFKCNEASVAGAAVISDSIGSPVITVPTSLTNNGDGTIDFGAALTTLVSGSWESPGAKKTLLLFAGLPAASGSNLKIGSVAAAANFGFQISGVPTTYPRVNDGTTQVIDTDNTSLNDAYCLILDWGTDGTGTTYGMKLSSIDHNNYSALSATTPASLAAITGLTFNATDNKLCSLGTSLNPAAIQIWHFDAVPSDYLDALLWTASMALTSPYNKLAYPGWRGRT